jgi:hypothetical protein
MVCVISLNVSKEEKMMPAGCSIDFFHLVLDYQEQPIHQTA